MAAETYKQMYENENAVSDATIDETDSSSKSSISGHNSAFNAVVVNKSSYPYRTLRKSHGAALARRRGQGIESDPVKVGEVDHPGAKKMRIVHISDTHMKHDSFLLDIPHGDVIVHSGDFTNYHESKGKNQAEAFLRDVRNINDFFSKLPHKHKIFVAGNHEKTFNPYSVFSSQIQQQLRGVAYLQDSGTCVDGLLFYGSPWNRSKNMGFSAAHDLESHWRKIPWDTDVLITHMPPLNILDLAYSKKQSALSRMKETDPDYPDGDVSRRCDVCKGERHVHGKHWGCSYLRKYVLHRVRPKIHLFGHVHNKNGIEIHKDIVFSNGAMGLNPKPNVIDLYYLPKK